MILLTFLGHDMFGDEQTGLDFSTRLSTAKETKLYRIVGSSLVIFYLTFTPMPISCPKAARMLFALMFLGLTICRLALFELYPEYLQELTQTLHLVLNTYLQDWTIFSAANLITFGQVALSVGFLVYFSLTRITREELVLELDQTLGSAAGHTTEENKSKISAIVLKYTPLAEAFKQQQKGRKVVGGTLLSAGILFLGLMFYEHLAI